MGEPGDGGKQLFEVMRRRGACLPEPLSSAAARELEKARRRCSGCNWRRLCSESLAAGAGDQVRLFCPNIHYIEELRGTSLTFG
jgi:hypothetical protein